jgi:hypothetical protein
MLISSMHPNQKPLLPFEISSMLCCLFVLSFSVQLLMQPLESDWHILLDGRDILPLIAAQTPTNLSLFQLPKENC